MRMKKITELTPQASSFRLHMGMMKALLEAEMVQWEPYSDMYFGNVDMTYLSRSHLEEVGMVEPHAHGTRDAIIR